MRLVANRPDETFQSQETVHHFLALRMTVRVLLEPLSFRFFFGSLTFPETSFKMGCGISSSFSQTAATATDEEVKVNLAKARLQRRRLSVTPHQGFGFVHFVSSFCLLVSCLVSLVLLFVL